MSRNSYHNSTDASNHSNGHSYNPLDLNGDGKDDATDDALRLLLLNQTIQAEKQNPSKPSRGCGTGLIVFLCILIPIIIVAAFQTCSNNKSSNKYSFSSAGTNKTKILKTSGKSSTNSETKKVTPQTDLDPEEYISGMFPAQGYYATEQALAKWSDDHDKVGDNNQYYKYSYAEFYPQYGFIQSYIIWIKDNGYIAHVNGAGHTKISSQSEGRYTEVYDVSCYSTAEQFYEDYKDEFHGFSEAEQYYNLHQWLNKYIENYGYKNGHFIRKTTKPVSTATLTPTPTPVKKPTPNPKKDDDPYDAKDYLDPDDFYYVDFIDYEEAEEYWEENQ